MLFNKLVALAVLINSIICVANASASHHLEDVFSQVLTVNSRTAIKGNTRSVVRLSLPPNTYAYVYRLTITKKGDMGMSTALFKLLKGMEDKRIAIPAALAELAIKNSENEAVDAYIFASSYDCENFANKKDESWIACNEMSQVANSCRYVDFALGPMVYFGFRNNNYLQGLDIKLEVVALVDDAMKFQKYTFGILNKSGQDMNFYMSYDDKEWEFMPQIRDDHENWYTRPQNYLYVKIYTTRSKFKKFLLFANNRNKLLWDDTLRAWVIVTY